MGASSVSVKGEQRTLKLSQTGKERRRFLLRQVDHDAPSRERQRICGGVRTLNSPKLLFNSACNVTRMEWAMTSVCSASISRSSARGGLLTWTPSHAAGLRRPIHASSDPYLPFHGHSPRSAKSKV